ncbi:unnamed protein product [Rhizophagus irregularis]|nr:unnamed protein product [Rhizophagus irregularis]
MVNKRVVEVGAGVSGLSTATLLLQQEKEIKVHLVAKHFPEDLSGEYTSPWYVVTYWNSLKVNIIVGCRNISTYAIAETIAEILNY